MRYAMDGPAGIEPATWCFEGTRSSDRAATQDMSKSLKHKNPGGCRRGSMDRSWLGISDSSGSLGFWHVRIIYKTTQSGCLRLTPRDARQPC